ncbi:hypothetical protein Tco_1506488 [Tanacetum coccineum]
MLNRSVINICHAQLTDLILESIEGNVNVEAPQLKNLIVRGICSLKFSADVAFSLETLDLCISNPHYHADKIVGLLQQAQGVKFLTLNWENFELLSSFEPISHQPSLFANLKSLKIYPVSKRIAQKNKTDFIQGIGQATWSSLRVGEEIRAQETLVRLERLLNKLKERIENNKAHMIMVENQRAQKETKLQWHESGICGMDADYVSALACLRDTIPSFNFSESSLRASHAQDFLLAILIDGLGQHMSPVEYRTILKYRVMISLFLVDAICHVSRKTCLDSFGEHAVHCKELPGFKYKHDMVRDILFDICRCVGISSKKEAPVNFLTDPSDERSTLRPADVLVFGRVKGKHACVYLTGVSPLVGLSSRGFTAGQAALKAASCKVTKHEKACIENQHVFIPFAFDTFGFLASEAVKLLSRVQRVMHSNVMTPRSTDVVF